MSVRVMADVWAGGPSQAPDLLMLLAIADHADDYGVAWPSINRLAEKCRVTPKTASATVQRLKRAGWVTVVTGGGTVDGVHGRTSRYQITLSKLTPPTPPSGGSYPPNPGRPTPPPTGGEPSVEPPGEPTTADAAAPGPVGVASQDHQPLAAERNEMPKHTAQPTPAEQPLEGMPGDPPKPPTAGDLVTAWCEGWSASHAGAAPDPSVVRRVAGICRNVAKDRTDMDSWRAAWRAAIAAGRAGKYDIVSVLAAPAPLAQKGNHYLQLAQDNAARKSAAGMLGAALAQPLQLEQGA